MTFYTRKRQCKFCTDNRIEVDYKNIDLLRHFLSSYSKIVPKKRTGACSKHQRQLATAIKRARFMSLLPY